MAKNPSVPLDYETMNAITFMRLRRWLISSIIVGLFSICGSFAWQAIRYAGFAADSGSSISLANKINGLLWPPPDDISYHPWTFWICFLLPSLSVTFVAMAAVCGRRFEIRRDRMFKIAAVVAIFALATPIVAEYLFGFLSVAGF